MNLNESYDNQVYVRIKPMSATLSQEMHGHSIVKVSVKKPPSSVSYETNESKQKSFIFSEVFGEECDNAKLFSKAVGVRMVEVLEGYNLTCFAYGMTGTGKTYTMLGDVCNGGKLNGLASLSIIRLFEIVNSANCSITASYFEIYNEQVKDLSADKSPSLLIIEDPVRGVFVPDCREILIDTADKLNEVIMAGNQRRIVASTGVNNYSSRSHAILQINIEVRTKERVVSSKLSLVDLAGSERSCMTGDFSLSNNKSKRILEGANINKSLLALGNCINILSDKTKEGLYVPYRDSKLTRLLKDSLGGNTRTIMIACISQSSLHYEETINTLKYASRAKNINKNVMKNVKENGNDPSKYKIVIDELKGEINGLKQQLEKALSVQRVSFISEDNESIMEEDESIHINQIHGTTFMTPQKQPNETMVNIISKNLVTNIEENWELKQSLDELDYLKSANKRIVVEITQELNVLNKQKHAVKDENKKKAIKSQIIKKEIEKGNMIQSISNNNKTLQELQLALSINVKQKNKIDKAIMSVTDIKERTNIFELQIALKKLLLEKTELMNKNTEMKIAAQNAEREKILKDDKINEMESIIENMKQMIDAKDKIINDSEQLLWKKSQELLNIKNTELQRQLSNSGSLLSKLTINTTSTKKENKRYNYGIFSSKHKKKRSNSFNFESFSNADLLSSYKFQETGGSTENSDILKTSSKDQYKFKNNNNTTLGKKRSEIIQIKEPLLTSYNNKKSSLKYKKSKKNTKDQVISIKLDLCQKNKNKIVAPKNPNIVKKNFKTLANSCKNNSSNTDILAMRPKTEFSTKDRLSPKASFEFPVQGLGSVTPDIIKEQDLHKMQNMLTYETVNKNIKKSIYLSLLSNSGTFSQCDVISDEDEESNKRIPIPSSAHGGTRIMPKVYEEKKDHCDSLIDDPNVYDSMCDDGSDQRGKINELNLRTELIGKLNEDEETSFGMKALKSSISRKISDMNILDYYDE